MAESDTTAPQENRRHLVRRTRRPQIPTRRLRWEPSALVSAHVVATDAGDDERHRLARLQAIRDHLLDAG